MHGSRMYTSVRARTAPVPALAASFLVLCVTCGIACGGAAPVSPPVVAPVAAAAAKPAPATTPASVPPDGHSLPRSAVREVVSQGLGAFLRRLELDDQPVRTGGRFRGFRIAQLRDDRFWNGVDLKPGDVVTAVNGFPIERPEQALTAFESLDVASELRITYDRDGQPRELEYAIVDDR
jgi:type II secretory pathway component PulC